MTERERKLVEAARKAEARLRAIAGIFNHRHFTDRHDDGPAALKRADELADALASYEAPPPNPVFSQAVTWDSRADKSIGMTLDAIEAQRDKAGDWK